jgi:hypothetical protein
VISFAVALGLLAVEEWSLPMERRVCEGLSYGVWSEPDANGRMVPVAPDSSSFEAHFPVDGFDDRQTCTWYTHQLSALDERPLPSPARGTEFRLTWLRSFHHPMSFRVFVDAQARQARLEWREADGAGGYDPGQLARHDVVLLDDAATASFLARLQEADICAATRQVDGGEDGAQWIFESSGSDTYCLHDAWSPGGALRELGHFLFDYASVPDDERY